MEQCCICLDNGDDLYYHSRCGHIFHMLCIHTWLKTGSDTCPLCLKDIHLDVKCKAISALVDCDKRIRDTGANIYSHRKRCFKLKFMQMFRYNHVREILLLHTELKIKYMQKETGIDKENFRKLSTCLT